MSEFAASEQAGSLGAWDAKDCGFAETAEHSASTDTATEAACHIADVEGDEESSDLIAGVEDLLVHAGAGGIDIARMGAASDAATPALASGRIALSHDPLKGLFTDETIDGELLRSTLSKTQGFLELMMQYNCALMEVETKLKVLSTELSVTQDYNPIESIKTRLKSPQSIIEKMHRRGYELSVESIERNLFDIAGARVICSFPEDIYVLEECLSTQDDISVVDRKDYIEHPKSNGYRSLHLILEVPIFLASGKKNMKVEVQFRTIAMDFWASLEHKLKYKRHVENPDYIARELRECAESINATDHRMQQIRKMIEEHIAEDLDDDHDYAADHLDDGDD